MIVVRIYEGLGNQMFEYAFAYALNKRMKAKGIKVYLDMRDNAVAPFDENRFGRPLDIKKFNIKLPIASSEVLKHWGHTAKRTILQKIVHTLAGANLWKYRIFFEEEFNYQKNYLEIRDNSYVVGWFQHYQYFEKYRKELLDEFTLKEEWEVPMQLKKILEEHEVISVHVRRGDYVKDPIVRRAMEICGQKYYLQAVDYLKSEQKNQYLFIFTNDEKWVNENLHFSIPSVMISNHFNLSDVQEMILMSQCNHNVIANSTFSWWGAWLNLHEDKIVIAPKKWFKDRKRKNIAMKNWIKM